MTQPHEQMRAILAEQRAAGLPALESLPIAAARAQFMANNRAWNIDLPAVAAAPAVIGGVRCLDLRPEGAAGTVVFVHGGGWTFGAPESHERFARLLAVGAGARVVAPDYRLAPEHRAPAGILDVGAVIAGLDGPIALCGDSAGANIALAAALDRPARPVAFLSLLYGCFAPDFDTPSHRRCGDGTFGLSTERMRWYWDNWLGPDPDPSGMPGRARLEGLPPCHLVAAGLDPLLDDSLRLAARLAEADVKVRLDVVPGVVHGFLQMTARLDPARDAATAIASALRAALTS